MDSTFGDGLKNKNVYLQHLEKEILLFDGAMGTALQALTLTNEDFGGETFAGCIDHLNLSNAAAVRSIHQAYLQAGARVIETNTFRANRITLAEFNLSHKTRDINHQGAVIARECADTFSTEERPCFVAGSLGPTGILLSLPENDAGEKYTFDEICSVYQEQAAALISGGADLLLIETAQDLLEVKAAVAGIRGAFAETGVVLPIQAQITLDINGRTLIGTDIAGALAIIEDLPVDVIGLNCSTGPEHMADALDYLSSHSAKLISCLPNAGMPVNLDGHAQYPLNSQDFAEQMADFTDRFHLSAVGGCCGTTPAHIQALAKKLSGRKKGKRSPEKIPALASAFRAVTIRQEPAPFIIGERLNTQGSRRFKQMMISDDFSSALEIAREQETFSAHALDLAVALTEDDRESERMQTLVRLLSQRIDLPLVIDSTDPDVMETALQNNPGRCLLNSVNLEKGPDHARRILSLVKQYNAAVIALTIDENGMAHSAGEKFAIARRIADLALDDVGLPPGALILDPLTFTLATGSPETADAAIETLDALQNIKSAFPDSFTVLGVSNISFGLPGPARSILNSVFLYHALQAGLDVAIINPAQMLAYPSIDEDLRALAEELIFNRSHKALAAYVAAFENIKPQSASQVITSPAQSVEERIRRHILEREKDGLQSDLDEYILAYPDHHQRALSALNTILLPAMQEIGRQFSRGELILPFVLQSAEIMRAATDHLEIYLEKSGNAAKGRVVLATVFGDVHDIGKNLTRTIIANNGYEVIDLGKQVPAEKIVETALEVRACAVGLSALLVSTSQQMPRVVRLLQERGAQIPILIGGAAVNEEFARRIILKEESQPYPGGVHYCRDAFDALHVLDTLPEIEAQASAGENFMLPVSLATSSKEGGLDDEIIPGMPSHAIPQPPFFGPRNLDIPLAELFDHLNQPALYRIGWGAGKARGDKWEKLQKDFAQRLDKMQQELLNEPWVTPQVVYGYFPCACAGDGLRVYPNPQHASTSTLLLDLPRQDFGSHLCLSDYFLPTEGGERDVIAFQFVTMGQGAVNYVSELENDGNLVEAFFAHGLATQLTEAASECAHTHIRDELKLGKNQGKRYSWGYEPLPDLAQQVAVMRLLDPGNKLGIFFTSAYQIIPEYSTMAMIVHHPSAKYFKMTEKD